MYSTNTAYSQHICHFLKLKSPRFSKDARQNCLMISVVLIWNSPPNSVVASTNLGSFKCNLSLHNELLLTYCVFDGCCTNKYIHTYITSTVLQ